MSDTTRKLVNMANQIADFFGPYSEKEAVKGIHEHIWQFWTPGMREELGAYIDNGGEGLRPRVIAAMERTHVTTSPIDKATAEPKQAGQLASDAG